MKIRAKKTSARLVSLAALAVVITMSLWAIGCGGGYKDPTTAVKEMLKARENGDFLALKATVLPDRVREMTDADDTEQRDYYEQNKIKCMDLEFETKPDEKDKDKASVVIKSGKFSMKNPTTNQEETMDVNEIPEGNRTLRTEKFKGGWYVDIPLSRSAVEDQGTQ